MIHFNTQQTTITQNISTTVEGKNEKSQDVDSGEESSGGGAHLDQRSSSNSSDDCRIYFPDQQPQSSTKNRAITTIAIIEPYVLKTLKPIIDPLQVRRKAKAVVVEIFLFFS